MESCAHFPIRLVSSRITFKQHYAPTMKISMVLALVSSMILMFEQTLKVESQLEER